MNGSDHIQYLKVAISEAQNSPPRPTNYRVGAVLVNSQLNTILSTGYTLELPGNTHAEQCCLQKLASAHGIPEQRVGELLPEQSDVALYTSMEPCSKRLSGNLPCVQRIIQTRSHGTGGVRRVYTGVREPDTFVEQNTAQSQLAEAGIDCIHIPGFEEEIQRVATAGHVP